MDAFIDNYYQKSTRVLINMIMFACRVWLYVDVHFLTKLIRADTFIVSVRYVTGPFYKSNSFLFPNQVYQYNEIHLFECLFVIAVLFCSKIIIGREIIIAQCFRYLPAISGRNSFLPRVKYIEIKNFSQNNFNNHVLTFINIFGSVAFLWTT